MTNQFDFREIYKLKPKEQTKIAQEEVADLYAKKQELQKEFKKTKPNEARSYLELLLPQAASLPRPTLQQTITRIAYAVFNGDENPFAFGRNVLVETDNGLLAFVKEHGAVYVFYLFRYQYNPNEPLRNIYAYSSDERQLFDLKYCFLFNNKDGTFAVTNYEESAKVYRQYPFKKINFATFQITEGKPNVYRDIYDEKLIPVYYRPNISEVVSPFITPEHRSRLSALVQHYRV